MGHAAPPAEPTGLTSYVRFTVVMINDNHDIDAMISMFMMMHMIRRLIKE
jgi:hypothetical protein